jgi:hypothetical protein
LEELQKGAPDGVGSANKEMALEEGKFQELFGTDKASFAKLPGWKKAGLKKKHGLF